MSRLRFRFFRSLVLAEQRRSPFATRALELLRKLGLAPAAIRVRQTGLRVCDR